MYIAIYSHLSIGTLDDISLKMNIHVNASNIGSHKSYVPFLHNEIKTFVNDIWLSTLLISLWITDSSH